MKILDGAKTAAEIKKEIAEEVKAITVKGGRKPHLAAVLVGNDGASQTYVKNKVKACKDCGFESTVLRLEDNISEDALIDYIKKLNNDNNIDGFIVQLPLPPHISENKVIETIDCRKDVDGFHPVNIGRMVAGLPAFVSATPKGIVELLKRNNIATKGKKCVIVGRSNIVGKPLANLMLQSSCADATVTICHSHTQNIAEECRQADILIVAIGKPNFITNNMIKEGAVVIDVGISRVPDNSQKGYHLAGDVDFEDVAQHCSCITPVPGGVGPMTISMLMLNTLSAAKGEYYEK